MDLAMQIVANLLRDKGKLGLTDWFFSEFILHVGDPRAVITLQDASHGGILLETTVVPVLDEKGMTNACQLLFDTYAAFFHDPELDWWPIFEPKPSEEPLSMPLLFTVQDVDDTDWPTVSSRHVFVEPYIQTASCAFSPKFFEWETWGYEEFELGFPVIIFNNLPAEDPNLATALRKFRFLARPWHFLPMENSIASLP